MKEAVFPFARFPGVDPILGPEMRSTGEVMGWDDDFGAAFLKTQIAAGVMLPEDGQVFVSVKDADKPGLADAARRLIGLGFSIVATSGTASYLASQEIPVRRVNKVAEGSRHIVDEISDGEIALVFNTTEGAQSLKDSQSIRETVLKQRVPYFTTLAASLAAVRAIEVLKSRELEVHPLQS